VPALAAALQADGWATQEVASHAPTREAYLRRPDWGRRLHADSVAVLEAAAATAGPVDLAIVAADGLSATAVQQHVAPLLRHLRAALAGGEQPALKLAPITIATQARVALADELGALLQARLVLILLGERPGLSAPDSVGAYLTHAPQVGTTDAQRNCISNIRPAGLPLDQAAGRLAWLVQAALRRRTTGIALKDDSATALLPR
jgi:ethanolamine ammonia-lyase small subunit